MRSPSRALALLGAAGLAALAVAGCANTTASSASSSSASSTITIAGTRLSIVISEPSDYESDTTAQDVVDAETLAFKAHRSEVTKYKLELLKARNSELSSNARAAIQVPSTVAYLGEIAPGNSDLTAGITNAVGILQISPTDTALELTQATPAVSKAPKYFFQAYSDYGDTFARVTPSSAQEAVVQADEMSALKVSSVYIADDGSDYGRAVADAVRVAAHKAGLTLSSDETTAGAVFYGTTSPAQGAKFFNAAASSNPSAKLFGTSSLDVPEFSSALSSSVKNLYVSSPGFLPSDLSAEGKAFVKGFKTKYGRAPDTQALFGFEAMSALLKDLQKLGVNADNRTDVVNQFKRTKVDTSVLGSYSIKSDGDTSLDAFVWNKLSSGSLVPFKAAS